METKELVIQIPDGMCIDEEKSTFEKIVFKPIDTKPRSWEEYCKQTSANTHWGFYKGQVAPTFCGTSCELLNKKDKASVPSKELAEAFLAMMQLISLRQAWIGDWDSNRLGYAITLDVERNIIVSYDLYHRPLTFPERKLALEFRDYFKDLLEQAKPLL